MNIIERLVSGYPQGDVSPQDFIDHLSIGAEGWIGAWVAVGLAIVFGMQMSFNPWCNMWEAIAPDFFSLEANPWYYIMGVVCLFFSVRGLVQYRKLPAK